MPCRYCAGPAGWWRRDCPQCRQLAAALASCGSHHLPLVMRALQETGIEQEHIERFLTADPRGDGSIADRLAAAMTNELLAALGRPTSQGMAVGQVRRLRQRGAWTRLGERPEELGPCRKDSMEDDASDRDDFD